MKELLIPVAALLIIGCGLIRTQDKVKDFIPGTYIRFSIHEFGKEYDTLVISLQNASANEYKIVRRWKYERMIYGKVMEPEYKIKITTAIYDMEGKVLQEAVTGKIYSIDPGKNCLFNGPVKFQKL
ncbi:MAG: hypothetical protein KGM16_00750 [Bacteroidota bacterium]|nr:hypothetical protein [Bacteroidota bacterium]